MLMLNCLMARPSGSPRCRQDHRRRRHLLQGSRRRRHLLRGNHRRHRRPQIDRHHRRMTMEMVDMTETMPMMTT